MRELNGFLTKLAACDLIVLTRVSQERVYCRFFLNGQYVERMFVTEPALVAELSSLCGEGEEITASGVAKLKEMLLVA